MADATINVDITEAVQKLDEVLEKLEKIYATIDKSWLLKIIFYGFKKGNAE